MNRKVIGILLAAMMLLAVVVPAFAEQEKVDVYENQTLVKSVAFIIGLNEYFVNDQVPGIKMDTAPFIQDGRTFIPVRFLGNALGVPDEDIQWNQAERRVDMKRGDNSLSMVIGKLEIKVNGQAKAIDVSPTVKDNRTFLPARYVAEGLGFEVDWDPVNHIVICWPKGEPKPELSNVVKYTEELKNASQGTDEKVLQGGFYIPKDKHGAQVGVTPEEIMKKFPDHAPLSMAVNILNPLEPQYPVIREVLLWNGLADEQTADKIIALIKTKTKLTDVVPDTDFYYNGHEISVGSDWYNPLIDITVWK